MAKVSIAFHPHFSALAPFGHKSTPHKRELKPPSGYRLGQLIESSKLAKQNIRKKKFELFDRSNSRSDCSMVNRSLSRKSSISHHSGPTPNFGRSFNEAQSQPSNHQTPVFQSGKDGPLWNREVGKTHLPVWKIASANTNTLGSFLSNLKKHTKVDDHLSNPRDRYFVHRGSLGTSHSSKHANPMKARLAAVHSRLVDPNFFYQSKR